MRFRKSANNLPVALSVRDLVGKDNQGYVPSENDVTSSKNVPKGAGNVPEISVISDPTILNGKPVIPSSDSSYQNVGSVLPSDDGSSRLKPVDVKQNGRSPSSDGHLGSVKSGRGGQGGADGSDDVVVVQKASNTVEMKRSLNLLYCTAIMVAVTGHSSIFVSPKNILAQTGSIGGALIIWLVGGLINLGMALCFAELGTMMPKAGGPYAYAMKSFGPLVGFLMMWGYTVLIAGPFWAFLANTAALYIVKPIFPDCEPASMGTAVNLLAGWIMVTMVVLNCVYMKYVTKVQTLLSSSKVIALAIIIAAGIYNLSKGQTEHLENLFEGTTHEPGRFALAIFYSVFSYGGWQVMTTMLEEMKDPAKDPPRSVYISFGIVITKYLLTNVAYSTLLSPGDIMSSNAVALLFIERLYNPLTILISILVAFTSIGALNASIMGHSRLLFAGARNGHMPQILGMVHAKYLTPWPSIFVYLAWGLVMLFTGGVTDMMEFISLFSTIMGIVCIAALLYLRWKQPDMHRPYKTMTFIPVVEIIVNIAVLVLGIYQKPLKMGIGLAIFFIGIPVYWFGALWKNKPKEFTSIVDDLTMCAQKIFMVTKVTK